MSLSPRPVLLADGDPHQREVAAAALRAAGYEVRAAIDGSHAVLMLAGFTPALAVIDLTLPELNGFQVLEAIKETIRLPTRVLMTSALASDAHRAYADALGADAFLTKPYTAAELVAAAHRLAPAAGPQPPVASRV